MSEIRDESVENLAESIVQEEMEDKSRADSQVRGRSHNENDVTLDGGQPDVEAEHTTITDLIKTKHWLENQLTELKTELHAGDLFSAFNPFEIL